MLKARDSKGAAWTGARAVCAGAMALSSLACSTQYVERSAVTVARSEQEYLSPESGGPFLVSQWNHGDRVSFQVQPAQCVTRVSGQPVAREVTKRKTSFLGGPGLVVGGLALGGLGTAGFISSRDNPQSCAEDDEDCLSKDDARGLSIVAWGLGAAGVAVGLYRAFKSPVELEQRVVAVGDPTFTDTPGPCHVSVAGVQARFELSTGASGSAATDPEGRITFDLNGDELPIGTTGTLVLGDQRFTIDLSGIARGEPPPPPPPPAPPGRYAACDFSDLPRPQTPIQELVQGFVDSGICKALLIKATEKGVDWGSDKAAERMLEDMEDGLLKDFLKGLLSEVLKAGASELLREQTPRGAEAACCVLERRSRMR